MHIRLIGAVDNSSKDPKRSLSSRKVKKFCLRKNARDVDRWRHNRRKLDRSGYHNQYFTATACVRLIGVGRSALGPCGLGPLVFSEMLTTRSHCPSNTAVPLHLSCFLFFVFGTRGTSLFCSVVLVFWNRHRFGTYFFLPLSTDILESSPVLYRFSYPLRFFALRAFLYVIILESFLDLSKLSVPIREFLRFV